MQNNKKFDVNNIKSVELNLLDSQIDLILKSLMFYKYSLEYVADEFTDSYEERQRELAKVFYTYEQINLEKAEQLHLFLIY